MRERWKSPVLWMALAALAAFITKEWCGWEVAHFDEFMDLLLGVLVAFGVVNNPTDSEKF